MHRLPPVVADEGDESAWASLSLSQAVSVALSCDHEIVATQFDAAAAVDRLAGIKSRNSPFVSVVADYWFSSSQVELTNRRLQAFGNIPLARDRQGVLLGSVTLPLYRGGRSAHEQAAGLIDIHLAELKTSYARRLLRIRVVEAFTGVLRNQSQLKLAQIDLEFHQLSVADATRKRASGTTSEVEGLGSQAALEHARFQLESAIVAHEDAKAELNRMLGRPAGTPVMLRVPDLPELVPSVSHWIERAHADREELSELRSSVKQALEEAETVRRSGEPHVFVHGNALVHDDDFIEPNMLANLGVSLDWNFMDGGRRENEAAAIDKKASGLAQSLTATESKVETQVRAAFRRWQSSASAIRAAEANLAYHQADWRFAEQQFRQGMKTNTEMIFSRKAVVQAEHQFNEALLDAILFGYQLRFTAGR